MARQVHSVKMIEQGGLFLLDCQGCSYSGVLSKARAEVWYDWHRTTGRLDRPVLPPVQETLF